MAFRREIDGRIVVTTGGTRQWPTVVVDAGRAGKVTIDLRYAVDVAKALAKAIDDAVTVWVSEEVKRSGRG